MPETRKDVVDRARRNFRELVLTRTADSVFLFRALPLWLKYLQGNFLTDNFPSVSGYDRYGLVVQLIDCANELLSSSDLNTRKRVAEFILSARQSLPKQYNGVGAVTAYARRAARIIRDDQNGAAGVEQQSDAGLAAFFREALKDSPIPSNIPKEQVESEYRRAFGLFAVKTDFTVFIENIFPSLSSPEEDSQAAARDIIKMALKSESIKPWDAFQTAQNAMVQMDANRRLAGLRLAEIVAKNYFGILKKQFPLLMKPIQKALLDETKTLRTEAFRLLLYIETQDDAPRYAASLIKAAEHIQQEYTKLARIPEEQRRGDYAARRSKMELGVEAAISFLGSILASEDKDKRRETIDSFKAEIGRNMGPEGKGIPTSKLIGVVQAAREAREQYLESLKAKIFDDLDILSGRSLKLTDTPSAQCS